MGAGPSRDGPSSFPLPLLQICCEPLVVAGDAKQKLLRFQRAKPICEHAQIRRPFPVELGLPRFAGQSPPSSPRGVKTYVVSSTQAPGKRNRCITVRRTYSVETLRPGAGEQEDQNGQNSKQSEEKQNFVHWNLDPFWFKTKTVPVS